MKRVAQAAGAAVAAHVGATAYCMRVGGEQAAPAGGAAQAGGAASVGEAQDLAKMVTQLYRGQKRSARLAWAYDEACRLETPVMCLRGAAQVERYFRCGVAELRPVQLKTSTVEASEQAVELIVVNEYTALGMTSVVPMRVRLTLDERGKVTEHREEWHGAALQSAFQVTREVNGWLFDKLAPR